MGDADADLAPRRGGDEAPGQLLERYGDHVYRLALLITGVEDDAAAVVEETLRAAARTIPMLTGEPGFEAWIYRTAAKVAYQRLRMRRPHANEVALDDVLPTLDGDGTHFASIDDWSSQIDDPARQSMLRTILTPAIDALPPDYRTALVLHDIEGVSKPHIAEILGIDAPAVSRRVHYARLFLRKRLSAYFEAAAAA